MFTSQELSDITNQDTWVQCDTCDKWRMLPDENAENLPEKWYCHMNENDMPRSKCRAPQRSAKWYAEHWQKMDGGNAEAGNEDTNIENESNNAIMHADNDAKIKRTKRDAVLTSLVAGSVANKQTSPSKTTGKHKTCPTALISKYYFHDSLSKFSSRKAVI